MTESPFLNESPHFHFIFPNPYHFTFFPFASSMHISELHYYRYCLKFKCIKHLNVRFPPKKDRSAVTSGRLGLRMGLLLRLVGNRCQLRFSEADQTRQPQGPGQQLTRKLKRGLAKSLRQHLSYSLERQVQKIDDLRFHRHHHSLYETQWAVDRGNGQQ